VYVKQASTPDFHKDFQYFEIGSGKSIHNQSINSIAERHAAAQQPLHMTRQIKP